jgi:hypothetical protein
VPAYARFLVEREEPANREAVAAWDVSRVSGRERADGHPVVLHKDLQGSHRCQKREIVTKVGQCEWVFTSMVTTSITEVGPTVAEVPQDGAGSMSVR